MKAMPIYDESKLTLGHRVAEHEKRSETEDHLKDEGDFFIKAFEKAGVGIMIIAPDGLIHWANQYACALFGHSLEELKGLTFVDRALPDYKEGLIRAQREFQRGYTESITQELFVQCRDGSQAWVQITLSGRKNREDYSTAMVAVINDKTRKKDAEAVIKKLTYALDQSVDGISIHGMDGRFIYVNRAFASMHGYSAEALIGMKIATTVSEDELKNNLHRKNHILNDGSWTGESTHRRKDGRLFPVFISITQLVNDQKIPEAYLTFVRDISQQKEIEAQLRHAQKMEALGTLAGGIAHNFNNLLMGIQGTASLVLLHTDPDHPHYQRLKSIEKLVHSGSKLTNQLLGYAREGRYKVKSSHLNQLVQETAETFALTKKEILTHFDLEPNLYGIRADEDQIEQVLLNLYINAAEAMRSGGDLYVSTKNVTHEAMKGKPYKPKAGPYVLLTVKDTGIGMDKETMQRIFDPFFTTKGLAEGTGLGLASTYGIIKAHGGYIDVDSEKGYGSSFSIYLPATEEVSEEKELSSSLLKGRGTILLIDDEENVLDVGGQMLNRLGYEVLLASGGQEALQIYKENQNKIDVVLLDMVMPRISGGETYDRMKEINPELKVLLISGYSINGQATEILKRGCDGFIQKPFDMSELSQKIREVLDKE